MTKTPPDSPAVSAQERQAARTLTEHLPQGYTADLVADQRAGDRGQQKEGESVAEYGRPSVGQRSSSGGSSSKAANEGGLSKLSPGLVPSTSASSPRSEQGVATGGGDEGDAGSGQHEEVSSLQLQGGDVHRSLFRMAEAPARILKLQNQPLLSPSPLSLSTSSNQQPPPKKPYHRRAATFHERYTASESSSIIGGPDGDDDNGGNNTTDYGEGVQPMPVRDMLAPQGFRRDFVQQQLRQRQLQEREATMRRRRSHLRERRAHAFGAVRMPIARNFVEFLELYGHFADEDLETSDDESKLSEEEAEEEEEDLERGGGGERRPLLERRTTDVAGGESGKAKAGMAQAFFTLLKAFVGTGIMFLPKAYNNGGMLFSTITLLIVSLMSMAGFELLLRCRQRYGGGYGDIGLAIAGPRMRSLILGSIALSQLGFVCAGIVFAAENLASFASAVAHTAARNGSGDTVLSTNTLIAIEVAALVPLGFVRDIARLGPAALLGDVCIVIGLVYMYSYDVAEIASRGWRMHETVELWFNPSGYALTIGAAIFTFEGIGLILPIQSSMARPERFGWLLGVVMIIITTAYVSVGALGYAAFGIYTKTEVIDNYPRDSPLVQAVQCLYALAVLAGMPVQLFPPVRIIEGKLFGSKGASSGGGGGESGGRASYRSGKRDPHIKWAKNGLRTAMLVACGAVAVLGAGHLDQFVALIGSLACVPLLFIYPPYLHYRGMAGETPVLMRAADIVLILVGVAAMIWTTAVTLKNGL